MKIENAHNFPQEVTLEKRNWYPASKLAGEIICKEWLEKCSGRKVSIIRLFHTYGPGLSMDDGRSFADFLWQSILTDKIVLKSEGLQRRTFLYVSDALSALLKLIEEDYSDIEIVDVGSAREISILQFAQIVSKITNRSLSIEPDDSFVHSKDSVLVPNLQRLRALGWTERVSLETGIMKTLESMRERNLN
jgi:nucleoside-diphosphate-sugar epimerase